MTPDCGSPDLPRLLAISQQNHPHWPGWSAWIKGLRDMDVLVQLREKQLDTQSTVSRCQWIRENYSGSWVVNSRADIAWTQKASGVHLTSSGYPISAIRDAFGPDFLIGRSTHEIEEVHRAQEEGADYVTFGPVFPSPGKGSPQGIEALSRVVEIGIPVFALGGISWSNLEIIWKAGAWGAAGIRLFFHPPVDLEDSLHQKT